jgi:transcription elongation GreA/GreB family factor
MNNIVQLYESHHLVIFVITLIIFVFYVISNKKEKPNSINYKKAENNLVNNLDIETEIELNIDADEISVEQEEEINERCTSVGSKVKLYYIKEDKILSLIISENTNKADSKNLHYKLPLALALYNKEAGSIVKFKKNEADEKYIYVEVLDVDNSEVKQIDEVTSNKTNIEKIKLENKIEPEVKKTTLIEDNYIVNRVLPISLTPNNKDVFLNDLLITKRAIITIYYTHKPKESKIWYAQQMTEKSDVIGNLRSRQEFRQGNWQEANIKKVEVSIKY